MKIVFITGTRIPSRAANCVHILNLCQASKRNGHEVELISRPPLDGNEQYINTNNFWNDFSLTDRFPIHYRHDIRQTRGFGYACRVLLLARQLNADLVLTRNLSVALCTAWTGLPTILDIHTPRRERHRFRFLLKSPGLKRITVISNALRNHLLKVEGVSVERHGVIVCPDGADIDRFADQSANARARNITGTAGDSITVGYSGHLYQGRGIELIIDLAGRLPQFRFLLVGGEDEHVNRYQVLARTRGLTNLFFSGYVPNCEVPSYLAACDILLMPHQERVAAAGDAGDISRWTSPLKMFEYLASGRPLISSDLPVLREVLNDHNAVLCPPTDLDQWQQAIEKLAADPVQRQKIAQTAKTDVARYTWRDRARQILADLRLA